jgi:hypothetical protein
MAATNVQAFPGDVTISSNLVVDTNTLFVDSVGNKVGIGSTTPGYALTVRKNTNTLLLESENGGTNADVNIDFKSYDSQDPVGARISAKDDSAFGSDILFSTRTGENGALTERMRIQGGGSIDINGYIRHIGDENNLFGFSGTDTFKIATAGADRLTVGANGTVTLGVNMEIPDYIHHVGDSNNYFGFSAADTFKITTANVDRLTVASNGTVTLAQGLSTSVTPGTYLTGSAYNGATARTFAVDATTAATASKVVARDTSADIHARLFRPNYADQSGISGAMAYRINNSNDSYIRFCSDTGNIRTFLNVPTRTGGDASGSWAITAAQATKVQVTRDDTGDTAMYLTMAPDNTAGQKSLYMDTNLIYDNTNNRLRLKQVMFGDQNVYGLGAVAGDYGSVGTVGTGKGSFEGYNINGHWGFISNAAGSCGIHNDSNNEWAAKFNQNGSTDLYYNGANKFQTTNTGAHVTGDLYADHMYIDDYLYHNGDTDTRIGFGTNTIYMRTAGTDRLTVSSGGNVTLSTALYIPNYIYHVGDTNTLFGFSANDTFKIRTGGVDRLTVNSSGNVGIGIAPTTALQIGRSFTGNDNTSAMISFTNSGSGYYDWQIGPTVLAGNAAFVIKGNADGLSSLTPVLAIKGTNFGFGTSSPAHKVHIVGTAHHIGFWQNNQNSCYVSAQNAIGTKCYFGADGQGYITPETTSVGFYNSSTGNMNYFNNGQRRAILGSDGRFYAQNFAIYSDERIKDNITDVDDAKSLEIIKQLQPRNYVMRENRDEKKWGFIAQEVEQVVPEVVNSIGTGTVCINKKYAITEYNPPVKLADIVYSNVSIADYATLDANVQVYYLGPDSSNTYYSNIVTDAIYSKSNVSALITDEVFVVDDCVKLSIDETYSLNVCCLNVSSVSSNVYVFQDDCRMTADDHDLPDMNPTDFIYIKSKEIEDTKTIDFGFMNPVLVSAMQQLIRTVDDLKERVTVLENI